MQKIVPSLWFDKECEEAMHFYVDAFNEALGKKDSKITTLQRYPEDKQVGPMANMGGKVLTGIFELAGYKFMALDGGPIFTLNPTKSFMLNFDPKYDEQAREHLDALWGKLAEGGKVLMEIGEYPFSKRYGWVEDKYGVSWQLILSDPGGDDRPFIVPSLLFTDKMAGKAEEAINFYLSVFKNSKKGLFAPYEAAQEEAQKGWLMYADFTLENQWFAAMDSSVKMDAAFNESISYYVECDGQEEVDYYWEKLSAVPESEQCGWLKDKYGVSWQIVPKQLGELMSDPDKEKAGRVMDAMLQMKKIDVAGLEKAYKG
jgi:predicted 3-demethylubiquinone-9 3-methyltransferase (glyoxalase superfamily)